MVCKTQLEVPIELNPRVINYALIGAYLVRALLRRAKNSKRKASDFRIILIFGFSCGAVVFNLKRGMPNCKPAAGILQGFTLGITANVVGKTKKTFPIVAKGCTTKFPFIAYICQPWNFIVQLLQKELRLI